MNVLVNIAVAVGGVLDALANIGGLLFFGLSIAYIYQNNNDGNLFWFLPDDEDDNWTDTNWRNVK